MTTFIFQDIASRGKTQNIIKPSTQQARDWFRAQAETVAGVNREQLLKDQKNTKMALEPTDSIGRMYMFFYDPKHKDTLPYYDRFPMIFPINWRNNGFLGINLHYISPYLRAKLMDSLYETANNQKYDDTTKLKLSYQMLNKAIKFQYFKPCVKQYLNSHVQSKFLQVPIESWDTALMLPTEQFAKMNKHDVWAESINRIK